MIFLVLALLSVKAFCLGPCSFSGGYLGFTAGHGITQDTFQQFHESFRNSEPQKTSLNALTSGIIMGWGKVFWDNVYAGFETAYTLRRQQNKSVMDATGEPDVTLTQKDALDVGLRLGIKLSRILPYLKMGWSSAQFETAFEDQNLPPKILRDTKRLGGWLIGIGVDVKISENMFIGASYTFVFYGTWKGKRFAIDNQTPITDAEHIRHERKPLSHNVMLRIGYLF